eukprot:scaffold7580_cov325-Pinguiococcus_pyrenoidosus.AAC.2
MGTGEIRRAGSAPAGHCSPPNQEMVSAVVLAQPGDTSHPSALGANLVGFSSGVREVRDPNVRVDAPRG